jgi:hypothetical protein
MPIPTRMTTPTPIHRGGAPSRKAATARPMMKMMKPIRYMPKLDMRPST